jgi:SpoVK/Ycf46/Vps4 family AAA+-type ATPase
MDRWVSLPGVIPSSSSSSSGKGDVFLRAIVSVLAGTAVTVISAFVLKYIVVDSLADKMLGAPDGSENFSQSNQKGKTFSESTSAHERLQNLRLSQHERSLLPDLVFPEDVDASVEDVGGLETQIRELREQVIYPLSHPHLYAHSAVAQRPTGMLLYGPPGTGKTLLAKAIAKSTKAAFLNVNVAQLQSKWFGETPKLVTALFSLARKLAPCILFVDEIDGLLGKRRDGSGGQNAEATATNVFLQSWEGLKTSSTTTTSLHSKSNGSEWVLVIGATNRMDALDPAVLRRMPRRVHVGMPDVRARADILRVLVRKEKIDPAGLDLNQVSKNTVGFSGSDLRELVREAAMGPIRDLIRASEQDIKDENKNDRNGNGNGLLELQQQQPRFLSTNDLLRSIPRVPASGSSNLSFTESSIKSDEEDRQHNDDLKVVLSKLTSDTECEECAASLMHLKSHLFSRLTHHRNGF